MFLKAYWILLQIFIMARFHQKKKKNSQEKMVKLLDDFKEYSPIKLEKIKSREETLNDAKKLYNNRNNVIKTFENRVFPFKHRFQ